MNTRLRIAMTAAVLLGACGDDDDSASSPKSDAGAKPEATCSVTIAPSSDDQSKLQGALIDATAGDTICLDKGRYKLTGQLSLATERVTVRGKAGTILDFSGQKSGANGIELSADHDTLDTLEIVDTKGDGVRAQQVDFPTLRKLRVSWSDGPKSSNGGYGLYPVTSTHVLIEDCYVSGASDTGIYVGQSQTIIVRNNEAIGNVAGIEVENSTDAEVLGNHSHGNSAGILVFNLPGLSVKDGRHANVHDNVVEDNNLKNFAAAGNIVADVPAGTGMFILAADDNEVHDNTIRKHDSVGIAVLSWYLALRDSEGKKDPKFDWYPERNNVHDNMFSENGGSPHDTAAAIGQLVGAKTLPDMVWDGEINPAKQGASNGDDDAGTAASHDAGTAEAPVAPASVRNCFKGNGDASFLNFDWAKAGARKSSDLTPYACTRPALPAIKL